MKEGTENFPENYTDRICWILTCMLRIIFCISEVIGINSCMHYAQNKFLKKGLCNCAGISNLNILRDPRRKRNQNIIYKRYTIFTGIQ